MRAKIMMILMAILFLLHITASCPLAASVKAETGEDNISETLEAPILPGPDPVITDQGESDIASPGNKAKATNSPTNPVTMDKDPLNPNENITIISLLDIIKKGGIVGYLIILLSIISLGLIIDYLITIRKSKILPSKDFKNLQDLINKGNLNQIDDMDHPRASFLTRIALSGLKESHRGYRSMVKAMEDAGEALTSGIARKLEHLNVIGNISPMMGLLGTVIGMLRCFNEISHMPGAIEPKQLAGGIFEALITTCMGLIVAIPSLYGYAVFRNRVDEFTGEAALAAEQLISSFKSNQTEE